MFVQIHWHICSDNIVMVQNIDYTKAVTESAYKNFTVTHGWNTNYYNCLFSCVRLLLFNESLSCAQNVLYRTDRLRVIIVRVWRQPNGIPQDGRHVDAMDTTIFITCLYKHLTGTVGGSEIRRIRHDGRPAKFTRTSLHLCRIILKKKKCTCKHVKCLCDNRFGNSIWIFRVCTISARIVTAPLLIFLFFFAQLYYFIILERWIHLNR